MLRILTSLVVVFGLSASFASAQSLGDLATLLQEQSRCASLTENQTILAAAQELAEGVTAEREAEISADLPVPYAMRVPATAQLDGEELTVPRALRVDASNTGDGWNVGMQGRRQGLAKRDCAIGMHVDLDIPGVTIVNAVILWRR